MGITKSRSERTFPHLSMLNPSVEPRFAEGFLKPQEAILSYETTWNAFYSMPGKLRLPVMASSVMR